MSGVFQVDRKIFEHSIWNNPTEFRLFFYILGKAVWKEGGVNVGSVLVERGQYLRSYRNLREDLMYMDNNSIKYYGIATIKRTIDKLVADGRLEKKETELGTLFTVVNYSEYQGFDRFNKDSLERQRNSDGTETEQRRNNKKKVKKVKNDNNYIYDEIFKHWIVQDIISHKEITDRIIKAMEKALQEYSIQEIKDSISTYSEAYHSDFYFSHKYTLEKFLKQSNGIPDWIEEGSMYENYMEYLNKDKNKDDNKTNWDVDAS